MHTSGFTNYQDIYFNVQLLNIIALQTPIINKKANSVSLYIACTINSVLPALRFSEVVSGTASLYLEILETQKFFF